MINAYASPGSTTFVPAGKIDFLDEAAQKVLYETSTVYSDKPPYTYVLDVKPADALKAALNAVRRCNPLSEIASVDGCDFSLNALANSLYKKGYKISTNDNQIEIYKENQTTDGQKCSQFYNSFDTTIKFSTQSACEQSLLKRYYKDRQNVTYVVTSREPQTYVVGTNANISINIKETETVTNVNNEQQTFTNNNRLTYFAEAIDCPELTKQVISNDELINILNDLSKEEKIKIYNFYDNSDNSKVTFNNQQYDLNDRFKTDDNSIKIDPTFAPSIKPILLNPKLGVELPDINYDNCTANAQKAIINCDKIIKKDGDNDNTDNNDNTDEQRPKRCDENAFNKKICDFIDFFMSSKVEDETDTKVDIQSIENTFDFRSIAEKNYLVLSNQCPANTVVNYEFYGKRSIELPIFLFCDFSKYISAIITASTFRCDTCFYQSKF